MTDSIQHGRNASKGAEHKEAFDSCNRQTQQTDVAVVHWLHFPISSPYQESLIFTDPPSTAISPGPNNTDIAAIVVPVVVILLLGLLIIVAVLVLLVLHHKGIVHCHTTALHFLFYPSGFWNRDKYDIQEAKLEVSLVAWW